MSCELEPGRLYRMPVHFGPSPGPRERPDGGRLDPDVTREALRVSVSFRTRAQALTSILPPGFALDGEPVARLEASYMSGIPWLAGRGYNTFGVTVPAVWEGQETVAGDLVAVLFENLADPIITGREELGWNKLWCELPDLERVADAATCRASWLGFQFARVQLSGLRPVDVSPPAAAGRPLLSYKYIPASGDWGSADVAYATVVPVQDAGAQVTEMWRGDATIEIAEARWDDLPTLFRIVNGLAALPRLEVLDATLTRALGSDDLYTIRKLS